MKRKLLASFLLLVMLAATSIPASAANYYHTFKFNLSHNDNGDFDHSEAEKPFSGDWCVQIDTANQTAVGRGTWFNVYKHSASHSGARDTIVMGKGAFVKNKYMQEFGWNTTPNAVDHYCLFGRMDQDVSGPNTKFTGRWCPYIYY